MTDGPDMLNINMSDVQKLVQDEKLPSNSTLMNDMFDYIKVLELDKKKSKSFRNYDILANICSLRQCCSLKCNRKDRIFYRCNGCSNVRYCSRKCQKYDWINRHKSQCTGRGI